MATQPNFSRFYSICAKDPKPEGEGVLSHVPPIYATSTFVYESPEKAMRVFQGKEQAPIYSRWSNPTVEMVEAKLAAIETLGLDGVSASALLFSSGMAAISSLFMALKLSAGEAIITQGDLYGTTTEMLRDILSHQGIDILVVDLNDKELVSKTLSQHGQIKAMYIETPANPTIACYDLKYLCELAKANGITTIVDNTFASPCVQQPFFWGADLVVHSATKFLNGHGTALTGVVIGKDQQFMKAEVWKMRKLLGGNSNAFEAFLLNNGLKTLPIRMERHCANAMQVASWLAGHPAVEKVYYVGLPEHRDHQIALRQMNAFGGMLSFELNGNLQTAFKFLKNIQFCTLTASLGTTDTLLQHPASMSHVNVPAEQRRKFGISDTLIRMSVGIESAEDIIADLDQAMQ